MRLSARTLRRIAPALICLSAVWWVLLVAEAGAVTVADTFVPQLMTPQAPEAVAPNPANARRRVALIIGNAAYRPGTTPGTTWPALINPLNDVTLIENAFRADGFEVTPLIDGTHDAMIRGITDFDARAAGAKTVVIYYAGHGFEYAGRNYLVPVDAPVQVSSSELSNRFIDLDQLTSAAVQSNGLTLLFLDACRTAGPVVTVDGGAGDLAPHTSIDLALPTRSDAAGAQVAVFYSTALGQPAFDSAPSSGANSPFAWNVAQMLRAPHIDLSTFFQAVTFEVERQTHDMRPLQQPYVYSSVTDDGGFYFADPLNQPFHVTVGGGTSKPPPLAKLLRDRQTVDENVLAPRVLENYSPAEIEVQAKGGDPLAGYMLGYFYEFGVGVPQDLNKARAWLERAAASDDPGAELELGFFLSNPLRTPTPSAADKVRALSLYEAAAAQNYAKAKTYLGNALLNGTLGPSDSRRAVALYRQAAVGGHADALYELAILSRNQQWASDPEFKLDIRDFTKGLAALSLAGDTTANAFLCRIAWAGPGVAADLGDCTIGAQGGDPYAEAYLASYYHSAGASADLDYLARHWTRLALAQSSVLPPDITCRLRGFGYVSSTSGAMQSGSSNCDAPVPAS